MTPLRQGGDNPPMLRSQGSLLGHCALFRMLHSEMGPNWSKCTREEQG